MKQTVFYLRRGHRPCRGQSTTSTGFVALRGARMRQNELEAKCFKNQSDSLQH